MATAILQVRLGSSRLPGKALLSMAGRPMLEWVVAALSHAPAIDRLVLAIPAGQGDDPLAQWASQAGLPFVRGPHEDVLERFGLAMERFPDVEYFRATADNPLVDPHNPGRTLAALRQNGMDYACESGLPLGAVVEGVTAAALRRSREEAQAARHREHVTLFIKESSHFRSLFFPAPEPLRGDQLRFTVDTRADHDYVSALIQACWPHPATPPDFPAFVAWARRHPHPASLG
jgi:spore coat polysaccharide biosynthesis protein SpsF (cytidylyltransferase family)